MAYPTVGSEGSVVSWGSANFYSTLLSRIKPNSALVRVNGNPVDITGLDEEVDVLLPGINSWTASIRAFWNTAPKLGNVGQVTWSAGGYSSHVREWELTWETRVHDITDMVGPSTAPVWADHRPDGLAVRGRIRCGVDDTTAVVLSHLTTTAKATLTLLYGDEATDDTLSVANSFISEVGQTVERGAENSIEFSVIGGQITPAGTTSPFGSSALATPLWSQGGAAAGAIEIASLTGSKKVTGTDSFYRSITVRCAVNQPVEVNVEVQGVGALTPA